MASVAIITARGGSKRIPRKNTKDFLGKPIIAYTIETAVASGLFDEVMVSTDDVVMAQIAENYGAKVPFLRSQETANDFSTTADVLKEVLEMYQKQDKTFQYGCCIYPTAPFITIDLLKKAYVKLTENKYETVFPIQKFGFPVQRALIEKDNRLEWAYPEYATTRSQDLVPTYHDAGQFYFFQVDTFLKNNTLLSPNTSGIEIAEWEAQDIDDEDDWKLAEMKYRMIHENL